MKKLKIENGGYEKLVRSDSQYVREKIEENLDILAESIDAKDLEIFSFDGKTLTVVTAEGSFISCNAVISEYGDLELSDFAVVEEGGSDDESRKKIINQLLENILNNDIDEAEKVWEQLVEAYRPFVIKGKIGRRHVSRAYYKMRTKSSGKGIVRSRRTGGILRRMKGRERQLRKYSSRRTARRGSTKRNRARSLMRRKAFRLKPVSFESVDFVASMMSEGMTVGITEANAWLDSCFLNWGAEEPAIATIYEDENGVDSIIIESASGYAAMKRDYDDFTAAKNAVVEGRRDAKKLHRNAKFQECVVQVADPTKDTTEIAESICTQFPNVAYVGKKSLSAQFAYCLGRSSTKTEVAAERLNKLAEDVIDSAWEFNPAAVQSIALAAEGWLFPENYQLPDDTIEAWRHISEQFDLALISEAKEAKKIVVDLQKACNDACKAVNELLPDEPSMYPDADETTLRGICNVLQSHCATLMAYDKNPSSVDPDRLAAIVDYLDDLSSAIGKDVSGQAPERRDDKQWVGINFAPGMYDNDSISAQPQIDGENKFVASPLEDGLGTIGVDFDTDHLVGDTIDDMRNESAKAVGKWANLSMEGYKISGSFSATIENDDDGTEEEIGAEFEAEADPDAPDGQAELVDDEIELIDGEDEKPEPSV